MLQTATMNRFRHTLKMIHHLLHEIGINPLSTIAFFRGLPLFVTQSVQFYRASRQSDTALPIALPFPCLTDRYMAAGNLGKHYFHQDLWAARKVYQNQPQKHVDIGSRIDGFIAHLLTFRAVEVLDVRPISSPVRGMTFRQADLMQSDSLPIAEYDSVSCLHALEHFGLGRYGDPIDPAGHIKGLQSLIKILKSGGTLLLSVPIGKERVEFNGHRVFGVDTMINLAAPDLVLHTFAYIDDNGSLHENANPTQIPPLTYGCGLFEFKKK